MALTRACPLKGRMWVNGFWGAVFVHHSRKGKSEETTVNRRLGQRSDYIDEQKRFLVSNAYS